jgi:hypoxanthine phosphoribosyltransferase
MLMSQHKLSPLLSQQEISQGVQRLAREIRRDYLGRCPLLVAVLKGSFIFLADLVRQTDIPLTLDFIQARSYRSTASTGKVKISPEARTTVRGRHVLLVEDIVDTGATIAHLMAQLRREEPASIKLCSLLDKPSRRVVPVRIDYLGFTVPDRFVVGYGLDLDQQYRYLPGICVVEET